VQQVISGGLASTVALAESTEAEQFSAGDTPTARLDNKFTAVAPGRPFPDMPQEEMLQPSGD
jgi:hypothetical protein